MSILVSALIIIITISVGPGAAAAVLPAPIRSPLRDTASARSDAPAREMTQLTHGPPRAVR